jgi:hypothetical protein
VITHIFPITILEIPAIRDVFGDDASEIKWLQIEEHNELNGTPFQPPIFIGFTEDGRRIERTLEQNVLDAIIEWRRNL